MDRPPAAWQRSARHRRSRGLRSPTGAAVAVVIAAAIGLLAIAAGCTPDQPGRTTGSGPSHPPATSTPGNSASPPAARPTIGVLGQYQVTRRWYTFARHPGAGGSARILHVNVGVPVLPAADEHGSTGLFPLVVFAPGYRQCVGSYSSLLRQWTSAGYVVAAVQFPETNCRAEPPVEGDIVNEPADVKFVISRLLRMSGHGTGWLAGLISTSRIAVAGHSDGGDLMAALAAASCCRDKTVRAALILSGAEWPTFTGWFTAPAPPMLFVQGTDDTWNDPKYSVQLYAGDTTGLRYYLDLPGADHFAPYEGRASPEPVVARVTLAFLNAYVAGQTQGLKAMRRAARVPGVSELVSGGTMP